MTCPGSGAAAGAPAERAGPGRAAGSELLAAVEEVSVPSAAGGPRAAAAGGVSHGKFRASGLGSVFGVQTPLLVRSCRTPRPAAEPGAPGLPRWGCAEPAGGGDESLAASVGETKT